MKTVIVFLLSCFFLISCSEKKKRIEIINDHYSHISDSLKNLYELSQHEYDSLENLFNECSAGSNDSDIKTATQNFLKESRLINYEIPLNRVQRRELFDLREKNLQQWESAISEVDR